MKKKKIGILLIVIVLLISIISIGTYAFWQRIFIQENPNSLVSDCLKIEFTESDAITLNKAYPILDEEGMKLTPYTFTITNVCSDLVNYQVNLETLNIEGKVLPDKYVKVNLSEEEKSKITTVLDKSTNTNLETETTINNAHDAYKLVTGKLRKGDAKTYNLRVWMDEQVPASTDAMNASWNSKVSVTINYQIDQFIDSGTLMRTGQFAFKAFWQYNTNITKVVFEPKIEEKTGTGVLSFDVSEVQDKSVMSYLVPNESDTTKYTLYIQSKGGVKANKYSEELFYNFTNLESIEGMEYLDTSNVTSMRNMFYDCNHLKNLNLSYFDTSQVTNMEGMFLRCNTLTNLNLNSFDTSNVTNMYSMFYGCTNLTNLDLSRFDTSSVSNMYGMFRDCTSLTNLDLSHFNTSNVINMSAMFLGCTSLTNLNSSNFDTSKVTNMSSMFGGCTNLTNLDISHFDTSNVTSMSGMFSGYSSSTALDLSSLNTKNVTDMQSMFSGYSSSAPLDLSHLDTSNVIDMRRMFSGYSSSQPLSLSGFDTSNVANMAYMFSGYNSSAPLDLSPLDTRNVTNMSYMFSNCPSLTSLNLSNFNMDKIENITNMFNGCSNLTNLDFSSLNINSVKYYDNVFRLMPTTTKVYVKDEATQSWILKLDSFNRPSSWTTENILIKNA